MRRAIELFGHACHGTPRRRRAPSPHSDVTHVRSGDRRMDSTDANVVVTGAARAASAPPSPAGSTPAAPASSSPTSSTRRPVAEQLERRRRRVTPTSSTEAGNVALIEPPTRRSVRSTCSSPTPASPAAPTSTHARGEWELAMRRQRRRPPLGREAPARRLARPWRAATSARRRRRPDCWPRSARRRTPSPSGPRSPSPSGCRSPTATRASGSAACARRASTPTCSRRDDPAASAPARGCGRPAPSSSREEVAEVVAGRSPRSASSMLPHPEVAEYVLRKAERRGVAGSPACAGCKRGSRGVGHDCARRGDHRDPRPEVPDTAAPDSEAR